MTSTLTRWLRSLDDRRLLVVGGASLDILHVRGTPTPAPGGAGLYTALAATRAGARVTMLAPRPDPVPDMLAPALDHITWIGPTVRPDELPRFELAYDDTGELAHFAAFTGAEPDMHPRLLDLVDPLPAVAYCVPFLDADVQHAFVRALHERGCLTVATTYGEGVRQARDTVRRTMAIADLFFCNRDEATQLFGSVDAAATEPGKFLFVTRGRDGARVVQGAQATTIAPVVVDAVDPTGAGDTFCGTTVALLMGGAHPVEAARGAAAAAAEEVCAIGPSALYGPRPETHVDPRVRVDGTRVGALASRLADGNDLEASDFTFPGLPAPGEPWALDLFFAATLQQFGFWHDDGMRYDRPLRALLGGTERKGSDLLWTVFSRWGDKAPGDLSPAGQAGLTPTDFARHLADDHGRAALLDLEQRHQLAVDYGISMTRLGWTPRALVASAATTARPLAALLRLLDHVGGYREDPLRKKSALLAVILRQRPEAWLPDAPGDDAPPIVDYHVQRTCLRTGMLEVLDPALEGRLADRRLLSADDEDAVRRAAARAVDQLVSRSGRSMGAVDWFLFQMRHHCPEMTEPDCARCPADPACAHRTDLFQPVRRTTFY